jgi:hypothetical protein
MRPLEITAAYVSLLLLRSCETIGSNTGQDTSKFPQSTQATARSRESYHHNDGEEATDLSLFYSLYTCRGARLTYPRGSGGPFREIKATQV